MICLLRRAGFVFLLSVVTASTGTHDAHSAQALRHPAAKPTPTPAAKAPKAAQKPAVKAATKTTAPARASKQIPKPVAPKIAKPPAKASKPAASKTTPSFARGPRTPLRRAHSQTMKPALAPARPAFPPQPSVVTAGPIGAQDLYNQLAPLVFVVRIATDETAPKVAYGSGFVVKRNGLLATNFHVISKAVHDSERLKVFVETAGGVLPAKIVGFDVVHDLALLQTSANFPREIPLDGNLPAVGARLFSLGIPQDLNLSIIEGIYNGTLRFESQERVQMSSPLNPGMSGGPTLDDRGKVVGVNVAILRDSQNIAFAVPVRFLTGLLGSHFTAPPQLRNSDDMIALVTSQLRAQEKAFLANLAPNEASPLSFPGWEARPLLRGLKCWSADTGKKGARDSSSMDIAQQVCDAPTSIYLNDNVDAGNHTVRYISLANRDLDSFRFLARINEVYNAGPKASEFRQIFEEKNFSGSSCGEDVVANDSGIPFKVNYCLRGYLDYPEVYDARIKMVPLRGDTKNVLLLQSRLQGVTENSVREFIMRLVNSVRER